MVKNTMYMCQTPVNEPLLVINIASLDGEPERNICILWKNLTLFKIMF